MRLIVCLVAFLFILASSADAEEPIVYYDMSSLAGDLNDPAQLRRYWDETHLVTTLQGLVNRAAPRLFIRYNRTPDDFWWNLMREEGGWMAGRDVVRPASLDELLRLFAGHYGGMIVYDERVPATSNVASTIAGVENLLAVRYDESPDSLYQRVVANGPKLTVKRLLLNRDHSPMFTGRGTIPATSLPSSGSAKNDAYRFLIENYVKTGRVKPEVIGYYLDYYWLKVFRNAEPQNHTLNNHDYVIAHRGVLFDLSVWDDEVATDDPGAPAGADYETMKMLFYALNDLTGRKTMIHAAGFVPWAFKYTGHAGGKHGDVESEWRYSEILSSFNVYKDADALSFSSFPNASFYMHFPLPAHIPQNPAPTVESLHVRGLIDAEGRVVPRNYYAHYQGDYDAAAWLYWHMPHFWIDPARGEIPMTWPLNPNLAERFPLGMYWTRTTRTANDAFIAGNSGAGYVNPYHLSEPRQLSGLPSGVAAWELHCRRFYEQWDIDVTGFIIDGNTPGMTKECWDAYARFSPGGIVAQVTPEIQGIHKGAPYLRITGDLPGGENEIERQAQVIAGRFRSGGTTFNLYRSVLKPPSHYVALEKELTKVGGAERMLVDLPTLMALIKQYESTPRAAADSAFAKAARLTAAPGAEEGLWPVMQPDGVYSLVEIHGFRAWELEQREPDNHLYMDVDEDFVKSLKGRVTIGLEYLDEGEGTIMLLYDSSDTSAPVSGAYKPASPELMKKNSGAWRSVTFDLPDPRFQGRQNGRSDFRIRNTGSALKIRKVAVAR